MKKTIIISAVLLILSLCGCSIETSSSSTSSITVNGQTTTTTTTTENGVTTTDTITTTEDDPTGLRARWTEFFTEGAEGVSKDGYNIYFAYDDPDDITFAAIMVLSSDNSELINYIVGYVEPEEDHFTITDVDAREDGSRENLPFVITDTEVEEGFEMAFQDGDTVALAIVDQATIINDMISLWEIHQEAYQAAH